MKPEMAAGFLHRSAHFNENPQAWQIEEGQAGQVQLHLLAKRGGEPGHHLAQPWRRGVVQFAIQHHSDPGCTSLNGGAQPAATVWRLQRLDITRVDTHSQPPAIRPAVGPAALPSMTIKSALHPALCALQAW